MLSVIISHNVILEAHSDHGPVPDFVRVYSGNQDTIRSIYILATALIESSLLKPQNIYFWLVTTKQQPTDDEVRFTFVFGEKEWKTDFLDNEDQLMKELESEINAMEKKMKK